MIIKKFREIIKFSFSLVFFIKLLFPYVEYHAPLHQSINGPNNDDKNVDESENNQNNQKNQKKQQRRESVFGGKRRRN